MGQLKPRVLLDGLVFPEGPRWRDGKLWFSDMFSNRVMTVDLEGRSRVVLPLKNARPSGLGFLPDGRLLIVAKKNRLLRLDPEGPVLVADLTGLPSDDINDMVVDAQGRAYIGRRIGPEGSIVLVEPTGSARIVAEGVEFPNGAVITPDGKTFIVAETAGNIATACDIAADGSLSNRRVYASVDGPDGMCLDAEGALWVGSPGTRQFVRVRPGGEITDRIPMPEGKVAIACMLGGPERRTLFMTTARTTMDNVRTLVQDFNRGVPMPDPWQRSQGFIEVVEVDVPGAGWP